MEVSDAPTCTKEFEHVFQALASQVPQEILGDLQCPQCGSTLHDPWTLGSGRTVCAPCVTRVTGEHVPPVANRLLASIVERCLPRSAQAVARRLEGNEFFKQGQWEQAVAAYSAALLVDDASPAAFANRSIAQLKMEKPIEAIADARLAVELRPLWAKSHHRLAAALRADKKDGEALVPLLRAAALEQCESHAIVRGTQVRILGLKTAVQHNGMKGTCVQICSDTNRYEVRLQNGELIKAKVQNVELWEAKVDSKAKSEIKEMLQQGIELPTLDKLAFPSAPAVRRLPVKAIESFRDELECCMCSNLFCEPAVLPCGHCMCRDCVARLLDHALQADPSCPLCRHNLKPLLRQINLRAREQQLGGLRFAHGGAQLTVCTELARLLSGWFPQEYSDRLAEVRAPQSEWVPIFVCSLSAPFIPTPLHIFEPRYRLMMRRAVESNQRFGMCLPTEDGFSTAGTMLFIDRFEQLPDGRSLVGTKGVSRFSVIQRGELDGYSTAQIQPFEEDTQGFPTSAAFHDDALAIHRGCQTLFRAFQQRQAGDIGQKLESQLGPFPDPQSPHFDAHISFYTPQLLQTLGVVEEDIAADLVFLQPERDRWQLLIQKCALLKPFGDQLQAQAVPMQQSVDGEENDDDDDDDDDDGDDDDADADMDEAS